MITDQDVKTLARAFWDLVVSGVDGSEAADLFINPGILLPTGEWMDLETHQRMHRLLCNESHSWLDLAVTPLPGSPERVLAVGTVHWEASFADGRPGTIKSDVGETWVIEHCSDEQLRWTLYWSKTLELADDSAQFEP